MQPTRTIARLGSGYGPRYDHFMAACETQLGYRPLNVSYAEFLSDPSKLPLGANTYLRIDSADRDIESVSALIDAGLEAGVASGYSASIDSNDDPLNASGFAASSAFYFGLIHAISLAEERTVSHGSKISHSARDVREAFDKTLCLKRLDANAVPVPRYIGNPKSFSDLEAMMDKSSASRVFVKLRYGSAAVGMTALARRGDDWRATTTAVIDASSTSRSTRDVQRLTSKAQIARLIDALAPFGLHVENWLPKTGVRGQVADLRFVTMRGEPVCTVLRRSRHPMTNLHLGGTRSSPDDLLDTISSSVRNELRKTVCKTAELYPGCHVLGIDAAILNGGEKFAVFEVNTFGDFIKDVDINGLNLHEYQLNQLANKALVA